MHLSEKKLPITSTHCRCKHVGFTLALSATATEESVQRSRLSPELLAEKGVTGHIWALCVLTAWLSVSVYTSESKSCQVTLRPGGRTPLPSQLSLSHLGFALDPFDSWRWRLRLLWLQCEEDSIPIVEKYAARLFSLCFFPALLCMFWCLSVAAANCKVPAQQRYSV